MSLAPCLKPRTRFVQPKVFGAVAFQKRTIIHSHYAPIAPRPPPREYEADGSLRRYKTNAVFYDHGISWARWFHEADGIYHSSYRCAFAEEVNQKVAYREQFRAYTQIAFNLAVTTTIAGFALRHINTYGISPSVYTQDWIEAYRERERAENSYPFTRYFDRRRRERGPHWMLGNITSSNPNSAWQDGQRDTAYLRARALKARRLWLEQEDRRRKLLEQEIADEEGAEEIDVD